MLSSTSRLLKVHADQRRTATARPGICGTPAPNLFCDKNAVGRIFGVLNASQNIGRGRGQAANTAPGPLT